MSEINNDKDLNKKSRDKFEQLEKEFEEIKKKNSNKDTDDDNGTNATKDKEVGAFSKFVNKHLTKIYVGLSVFFVSAYILFFISPYFIGGIDESNLAFTKIGEETNAETSRTFVLENWEYSKAEKKMLVEISIDNKNFDNKMKNCQYTALEMLDNGNTQNVEAKLAYSDDNYNVVTIENIDDDMAVVSLKLQYDSVKEQDSSTDEEGNIIEATGGTDTVTCRFKTNKNVVTAVTSIKVLDKNGYELLNLQRLVAKDNKKITDTKKEISNLEKKKKEISNTIHKYEKQLDKVVFSKQEEINNKIQQLENKYEELESKRLDYETNIVIYNNEIADAEYKIAIMKGEPAVKPTEAATKETNMTSSNSDFDSGETTTEVPTQKTDEKKSESKQESNNSNNNKDNGSGKKQ